MYTSLGSVRPSNNTSFNSIDNAVIIYGGNIREILSMVPCVTQNRDTQTEFIFLQFPLLDQSMAPSSPRLSIPFSDPINLLSFSSTSFHRWLPLPCISTTSIVKAVSSPYSVQFSLVHYNSKISHHTITSKNKIQNTHKKLQHIENNKYKELL